MKFFKEITCFFKCFSYVLYRVFDAEFHGDIIFYDLYVIFMAFAIFDFCDFCYFLIFGVGG